MLSARGGSADEGSVDSPDAEGSCERRSEAVYNRRYAVNLGDLNGLTPLHAAVLRGMSRPPATPMAKAVRVKLHDYLNVTRLHALADTHCRVGASDSQTAVEM
eukprot:2131949-Prymnesium_polylepis.1